MYHELKIWCAELSKTLWKIPVYQENFQSLHFPGFELFSVQNKVTKGFIPMLFKLPPGLHFEI